jgi:hypothetical protein
MRDYSKLVEQLYDIHHFAHQHEKVASNRIRNHYDQLANVAGFQEECGCTTLPGREENHPSCRRAGKVPISSSPRSTTSYTGFSSTPEQR